VQIGLMAFPNGGTRIYYEITRPGGQPVRTTVREGIVAGQRHHFGVLEVRNHPSWWRAWLDGRAVSKPVFLPRSHDRLIAQATGESYAGLTEGRCNDYSFAFQHVSLDPRRASSSSASRSFNPFEDPNYLLERTSTTSFVARSVTRSA
jgi:hypothetical protein